MSRPLRVARPVIHDAAAELGTRNRLEVDSEGLKHADDFVGKMGCTKDVASQIKHYTHRMGRFGVVPNPGSFARRNQELLEISNLADVLVEIRFGHFELELAS
jgi:hypothetical protein